MAPDGGEALPAPENLLSLRPLLVSDEEEARAAHEELLADDFSFLLHLQEGEAWPSYLRRLEAMRTGEHVPEGMVPSTFLVAEISGRIVGRVSVRHRLNPWLARWGGHIGYAVRPAFRRRGYAAQMLQQALVVAGEAGLGRVMLTCDVDNAGSAAVIERCGGLLDGIEPGEGSEKPKRRYWIELAG